MPRFWLGFASLLVLSLPLRLAADGALSMGLLAGNVPPSEQPPTAQSDRFVDPVSAQGQAARGLYFNGPMARHLGAKGIIGTVRGAQLDAAVIDIKDGEGRVLYDTKIESLLPQKRLYVKDMAAFVREIKAAGIYTIARVVCFSDPDLPRNEPARAVMDSRPQREGRIWADTGKRNTWLDPYNEKNHELIANIARDVEAMGFDELQLDYVRFPVDEATRFARFPAQQDDRLRRWVILALLRRVDEAITIPISTDVFGLTALRVGDPAGLGQSLEDWVPHVEIFSPMLYVNGMKQWVKGGAFRAQRLVDAAVGMLRSRVGYGPVIRPFLQAFKQGADHYDGAFVAEQIRGAHDGGADGFLFWHPGSSYAVVQAGMAGPIRLLTPFAFPERSAWRRQTWRDAMSFAAREAFDAREAPPAGPNAGPGDLRSSQR